MERLKKYICFLLSLSIIVMFPLSSYAATVPAAPAVSVANYAFNVVLNACGVESSLSGINSMLGQWDDYTDYQEKGQRGELSAYSQWLYNRGHTAEAESAREKYREQQQTLTRMQSASWGDVLDIGDTYASTKEWLSTFPAYGTDSKVYQNTSLVPPADDNIIKPSGAGEFVFSSVSPSLSSVHYANYYFKNVGQSASNVVALLDGYNSNMQKYYVSLYYVESSEKYYIPTLKQSWRAVYDNGKVYTGVDDLTMRRMTYEPSIILSFPFPVFSSMEAMESYISTGVIGSIPNSSVIGLPIEGVRPAIQNATINAVPSSISLPTSIDLAEQLLGQLGVVSDVDLKAALAGAGLVIDWDFEDVDEGTADEADEKAVLGKLSEVLAKIEAIPAAIDTFFNNKMESEETTDENTKRLSLPSTIASKFPFCIPFDLAYLVTSLRSSSEVPQFELPIKFDYLSFHYDETFIVDMAQWDTAVQIFRIMLDVLFVAGLIAATRNLIRG